MRLKNLLVIILLIVCRSEILCEEVKYKISADIELIKLVDNFYVYTTWYYFPKFGRFPSNGLIFLKNQKAILIDTPNSNEQTEELLIYLTDSLQVEIEKVIVCHSHSDCLGGLSYLHSIGVESISGIKTQEICKSQDLPIPKKSFSETLELNFEGEKIICRYFGGGHTVDNIVVYFPNHQILFGGCLIRSLESKSLGNISEAVIEDWDRTVINLKNNFTDIKYVIPGHGNYGNADLMNHTINLVEQYRSKKK